MNTGKNGSKKSSAANDHALYIKVIWGLLKKYTMVDMDLGDDPKEIRAIAKAWLIVGEGARDAQHFVDLLEELDWEMFDEEVPLPERGTHLLRRVSSKPLPNTD